MTNANTQVIAKVAAVLAGLGLVAMSFAAFVAPTNAQTSTTTTTTTSTAVTFSRNLTIGSRGVDVTALQQWLIAKGFSIPAGATGYFGAQSKAAVAAYQASKGIVPAVGFFGPITRAAVMADGSGSSTTGGTTTGGTTSGGSTSGSLSGNEASLRNFNLVAGDDLNAGDTNKEIALARFDVRNGDARVQRITVELQPVSTNTALNKSPWQYIDTLSVYNGSKKVGSVDVSNKSAWDKVTAGSGADFTAGNDYYSVDVPVDTIVRMDAQAELSIRADAISNIDAADAAGQTFNLQVPANGVRAVDAKGIQQYIGGKTVVLGFSTANAGNLVVSETTDNPSSQVLVADAQNTSSTFDVLTFQLRNKDNVDVDLNTLKFTATTTGTAVGSIVRKATLNLGGKTYTGTIGATSGGAATITFDNLTNVVKSKATVDGTLSVDLFGQSGHFNASGETLKFALNANATNVDASSASTGKSSTVSGSALGNTMSVATNVGISLKGGPNSANATVATVADNSYGTFTVKFSVTASGDDVYIPATIAKTTGASTTAGIVIDTDRAGSTSTATTSLSLDSSANTVSGGAYYIVHAGNTETFTATATINPATAGYFQIGLDAIHFNDTPSTTNLKMLDVDQTDAQFKSPQQYITS